MNSLTPQDIHIVEGIPPVATLKDKVAIDTEFFGMDGSRLHRPHGQFACATFCFDGVTVYVVTNEKDLPQAMKNVDAAVHIMHNAKFDIGQLRRWSIYNHRLTLWDTQLIEQVRWSGYYDAFALKDLARRYLGIYMDKSVREEFSHQTVLTDDMLNYSALDCAITWRIFKAQRKVVDLDDLNVWKEIECPYLFVLLGMGGIRPDQKNWRRVAAEHKAQADAIQEKYGTWELHIGKRGGKKNIMNGILLTSWQQVKAEIERQGFEVKSTNEDDIRHLAPECEFVRDVLLFREHAKAASTYGTDVLELVEEDGRIHFDMHQIGAGTGRTSSSKPNLQNIPNNEQFRSLFIPEDDFVYVDGDWSQQEPRITAFLSHDSKMIRIFKNKLDIYIEAGRLMFGWELTKQDKRRKERMKPTVLGACYGLTEYGLLRQYDIPLDEGKELMAAFWNAFPETKQWKNKTIFDGAERGYVTTVKGRKFWLNPHVRGWENNCLNSPVQGSGGDALKLASIKFMDLWGWGEPEGLTMVGGDNFVDRFYRNPIVNEVHDEILLEVPPTLQDVAANLLRKAMLDTAEEIHKGIPADVEIKIGHNWWEVH